MKGLNLRLVSRCCSQRKADREAGETTETAASRPAAPIVPWIRILGWTSVATGTLALGYFVGRNLRARYLMSRRTPYDFYSHAGDNGNGVEYGVGI